jgi:hypothetical protein
MMRWLSPGIAARMPPRNRPMDAIPDLDDTEVALRKKASRSFP